MTWISYAQNCEDVALLRAFKNIFHGFYIDVGAFHPTTDSVTKAFYDRGWRGINIEPVHQLHAKLVAERPRDINLCVAVGLPEGEGVFYEVVDTGLSTLMESTAEVYRADGLKVLTQTVPIVSLSKVCARHAAYCEIHFLKIDVEGSERQVLASIDLCLYRPWVVLIEATRPRSSEPTHSAWESLLLDRGYQFVWFDGLNRFYVADERQHLRQALSVPPSVLDGYMRYTEWFLRRDVEQYAELLEAERSRRLHFEGRVQALQNSRSWRWSAPARFVSSCMQKVFGRSDSTGATDAMPLAEEQAARAAAAGPASSEVTSPRTTIAPGVVTESVADHSAESKILRSQVHLASEDFGIGLSDPPDKPRLALVTPWPPAPSGVAEIAASLLSKLQSYYLVEVVATDAGDHDYDDRPVGHEVAVGKDTHQWSSEAGQRVRPVAVRRVSWFVQYAHNYDRICHHLGNALLHEPQLDLIERFGGTVVVHDVLLSDLLWALQRTERRPQALTRALFASHGWPALVDLHERGAEAAVRTWPASASILRHADGLIVSSDYARRWMQRLLGYGPTGESDKSSTSAPLELATVPLPQAITAEAATAARQERRALARSALSIPADALLIASFGAVDRSKMHDRIVHCWDELRGSLQARGCFPVLVFVGDCHDNSLAELAQIHGVRLTGRVTASSFSDWLLAADIAVQLRKDSRGESSGALLQVFAAALPVVLNRHGPMADLPEDVATILPETFGPEDLSGAILGLNANPSVGHAQVHAAQAFLRARHDPALVALRHAENIERHAVLSRRARQRSLLEVWRHLTPQTDDALITAHEDYLARSPRTVALAAADPPPGPRSLWIDVTAIKIRDLRTGVQRVTRNFLRPLLERGVEGWRLEPVFLNHGRYWTARHFTGQWLGLGPMVLEGLPLDEPVEPSVGDVFFGLDLVTDGVHQHEQIFKHWSRRGVRIAFMVHDLLPLEFPQWFPQTAVDHFQRWWQTVRRTADTLVCNSQATARNVALHWPMTVATFRRPPVVAAVGLGADLDPKDDLRAGGEVVAKVSLGSVNQYPHFDSLFLLGPRDDATEPVLVVGTIEPRKGIPTVLAVMERWWRHGGRHPLLIVGRPGWMVENLEKTLREHPEQGRRLFWLEHVDDVQLGFLYAQAKLLVMASYAEGYGLPLVEALSRGAPVLARDLPVFREIAGSAAGYWNSSLVWDGASVPAPDDLQIDADALWPTLRGVLSGDLKLPDPGGFVVPRWEDALGRLVPLLLGPGTKVHRSAADGASAPQLSVAARPGSVTNSNRLCNAN